MRGKIISHGLWCSVIRGGEGGDGGTGEGELGLGPRKYLPAALKFKLDCRVQSAVQ